MKLVSAVYVGELSGVVIPDLDNLSVKRGEAFRCPEDWYSARVNAEPTRWKLAADAPKDVK